jgi:hypothetical protein
MSASWVVVARLQKNCKVAENWGGGTMGVILQRDNKNALLTS